MNATTPRISIIVPSFNHARYIGETIDSILSQDYPNYELFVVDGGSTDNTVEVLKNYGNAITWWCSEKDRGQTHAINKGLARATGEIIAYINSDDYYLPGAFRRVVDKYLENPNVGIIHGICEIVSETGEHLRFQKANISSYSEILDLWGVWWNERQFVQPEVFWTKRISDVVGEFNEKLYFVMDYDYWARILCVGGMVATIDAPVSCFRITPQQKSTHATRVATELTDLLNEKLNSRDSNRLSHLSKIRLRGNLVYHRDFCDTVRSSLEKSEGKLVRWSRLGILSITKPSLLLSPLLWRRAREVTKRSP